MDLCHLVEKVIFSSLLKCMLGSFLLALLCDRPLFFTLTERAVLRSAIPGGGGGSTLSVPASSEK